MFNSGVGKIVLNITLQIFLKKDTFIKPMCLGKKKNSFIMI